MSVLALTVPIKLVSEANQREHWAAKHTRKKGQQTTLALYWLKERPVVALPVNIYLIRIAPRDLDADNLVSAFKHVQDKLADLILPGLPPGRADNHQGITWHYLQEKGGVRNYALRIEIEPRIPDPIIF